MKMNIGFKTTGYSRNYDLMINDDSYVTDYDGEILSLEVNKKNKREVVNLPIGEFGLTVFNLDFAREVNYKILPAIEDQTDLELYNEFFGLIHDNVIEIEKCKKIVLLHTYFLIPEYRNKNITEHLIEFLYKNFYDNDVLITAFVVPFQYNTIEYECVKEDWESYEDYYLEEFLEKNDIELNFLNIYKLAARYGFKRFNETNFFYFTPEKIKDFIKNRNVSKKLSIYP